MVLFYYGSAIYIFINWEKNKIDKNENINELVDLIIDNKFKFTKYNNINKGEK